MIHDFSEQIADKIFNELSEEYSYLNLTIEEIETILGHTKNRIKGFKYLNESNFTAALKNEFNIVLKKKTSADREKVLNS